MAAAAAAAAPPRLVCAVYAHAGAGLVVLCGRAADVLRTDAAADAGLELVEACAPGATLSAAAQAALGGAALVLGCGPHWIACAKALTPLCGRARVLTLSAGALARAIESGVAAHLGVGTGPGGATLVFAPPPRGAIQGFFAAVRERRDTRAWPLVAHLLRGRPIAVPGIVALRPEHAEAYIALRIACAIAARGSN